MYIEDNGFLVMHAKEMSFIGEDGELTDDLKEAQVFLEEDARTLIKDLMEETSDVYELVNYRKTIWIDKMFIDSDLKCKNCCEKCQNKEGEEADE